MNSVQDNLPEFYKKLKIFGADVPHREFINTATTNKAASVLHQGETVHRKLGIVPRVIHETGHEYLSDAKATPQFSKIMVVDEASYECSKLHHFIDIYTPESKIIHVGDMNQLKAVGSKFSVFDQGHDTASLTIPMRQDPDSDLYKLCQHLRDCVINGTKPKWFRGEGIHLHGNDTWAKAVNKSLLSGEDAKIIAYKNTTVDGYNGAALKILNKDMFDIGNTVISGGYVEGKLYAEQEVHIHSAELIKETHGGVEMNMVVINRIYVMPLDKRFYAVMKRLAKQQDWGTYYRMKNNYAQFRPGYALTSYKSQGSSYDKVFVDLPDIYSSGAYNLDSMLRQLYVAISRAKTEVHLYGG